MACSYKTITLTPGEQFILPSGAEIITVSDTTALEVTNGCTALDKLEDYKCYISYFLKLLMMVVNKIYVEIHMFMEYI